MPKPLSSLRSNNCTARRARPMHAAFSLDPNRAHVAWNVERTTLVVKRHRAAPCGRNRPRDREPAELAKCREVLIDRPLRLLRTIDDQDPQKRRNHHFDRAVFRIFSVLVCFRAIETKLSA